MITISLSVNKVRVYDEVAKTTAYVGSKMTEDEGAYSRIFTTDDDRMMLERFWVEACSAATETFKPFIVSVSDQPESHGVELERNYDITLELSSAFDERLKDSIETSLFSFFVASIVSKWCKFSNKSDAEGYGNDADNAILDIESKIYYRRKPKRVEPK